MCIFIINKRRKTESKANGFQKEIKLLHNNMTWSKTIIFE